MQDVQPRLKEIVGERVADLPEMGVGGDDLSSRLSGQGSRIHSLFQCRAPEWRTPPEQYLEEVQREVVETFCPTFSVSPVQVFAVDPVTQFYVMGRFEFGDT